MRILLAIDGSAPAGRAVQLVDHVAWPAGSTIRVVAALEHGHDLVGIPDIPPAHAAHVNVAPPSLDAIGTGHRDIEDSLLHRLDDTLDGAVLELQAPDRTVDRVVLRGRAASAIVKEAQSFGADLVVVGHRGHGRIPTMLLGSVSAEVVDHAPCPVLVTRGTSIGSLLVATDASHCAAHAMRFLVEHRLFAGVPVRAVSVAEVGMPWSTGMSPGIYDQVIESYTEAVDEARRQAQAIADAAAATLAEAGYRATGEEREGDAAAEIIADAAAHKTDLIVTGTRGHTGLARLLLGSTARKLLINAPCSVLVVRENARVAPEPAASGAVAVGG